GGVGHDKMTGGAGNDKFVFNASAVAANSDTITDFTHDSDKIQLDNAIFTALGAHANALAGAKFFIGAAAHDSNDRIIYDSATGKLFYDSDGTGSHEQALIVTLGAHPALSANDITVI